MRVSTIAAVPLLMLPALSSAQAVPPGWKVMKDSQGACQVAVPPLWTGQTSVARDPSHPASAVVHGLSRGQTWDRAMAAAKIVMKPVKMFEDGPRRVFYAYSPPDASGGGQGWYAAVPGTITICTAQVEFKDPALEATAKAIVESLGPAK